MLKFEMPSQTSFNRPKVLPRVVKAALECMRAACRKDAGLAIREDGSKGKTCVDFDDMTYLPVRLGLARATYDLTVVDEAQDMSPTQILLAQALTYSAGRMVYVGDSEQAIYSWRGADVNVLSRVVEDFGATVLPLNITHRCPKSVVALAAQIVPDFTAADDAPDGIVDSLATPALLLATAKPGDAILSRKNAPLADLCLALLRNGVRARIEGRDIGAALCGLARKVAGRAVASMTMETFSERLGKWADRRIAKLTESAIMENTVESLGALQALDSLRDATPGQALRVVALSYPVALVLLTVPAVIIGGQITAPAVHWGLLCGVAQAFGVWWFYAALAKGPISVVSPLTAILVAGVPVAFGIAQGEQPGPPALVGIVVALQTHWSADGISVGNATLFDEHGPIGTGLVTAIANPAARIDFGAAAPVSAPGSELFTRRSASS